MISPAKEVGDVDLLRIKMAALQTFCFIHLFQCDMIPDVSIKSLL